MHTDGLRVFHIVLGRKNERAQTQSAPGVPFGVGVDAAAIDLMRTIPIGKGKTQADQRLQQAPVALCIG